MSKTVETTREMKNSGIEWIGDIPKDWDLLKLSYGLKIINGYSFKSELYSDSGMNVIRITNIENGKVVLKNPRFYPLYYQDTIGNAMLSDGDLLMTLTGDVGCVGLIEKKHLPAGLNQRVACLRIFNVSIEPKYLYYLFNNSEFVKIATENSNGTAQLNLSTEWLKSLKIPLPPLHEQQAIATYLEEQVEKIDGLISAQKQAIEKWKDYKQSLITETVTKGLNPNVEMKDSGVEWIGMIPRDWAVKKLKYFATIFNGKETESREGDIPIYGSGGVVGFTNKCTYTGDSVLLGRKGTIDKPLFVSGPFWNIDTAFATRPKSGTNMKFFYYCCLTLIEFKKYISGSAIPSMTQTILNETILVAPPLQEQQAIADYLDEKCSKIDETIEQKQALIKQLEEYKQSLIYECVTGKRWVH